MRNIVLILCLLAGSAMAQVSGLQGSWVSVASETAGAGTLAFDKDGTVTMTPAGGPTVVGTYAVSGDWLDIDLTKANMGKASMIYTLKDGHLDLAYTNGVRQTFTRESLKKSVTKAKSK